MEVKNKVQISLKFVEGHNPKLRKFWGKIVSKINPEKNNGYAFEGDWLNGWGGEKVAMAEEGQLVMIYAKDGSWKHSDEIYAIGRVKAGAKATLCSDYYIRQIDVTNIEILYVLKSADGWSKESTELFKKAMQIAGRTIKNPWDCLKVLIKEGVDNAS